MDSAQRGFMTEWIASHPAAIAAAVSLAALWFAESMYPLFAHSHGRRAHGARNLALGVINGAARALFFPAALVLVAATTERYGFGALHAVSLPAWVDAVIAVVALDAAGYAWHVASHQCPLLWRFHAVHHHDDAVDSTTALRFHVGDVLLGSCATLAAAGVMGLSVEHVLLYEVLLVPLSVFHHGNVRLPGTADRALSWLIVTPRMHWVHHSRWVAETDSNYSPVLSVWDRLFGTYTAPGDPGRIRFGLDGFTDADSATLLGCLATPLYDKSEDGAPPGDLVPEASGDGENGVGTDEQTVPAVRMRKPTPRARGGASPQLEAERAPAA